VGGVIGGVVVIGLMGLFFYWRRSKNRVRTEASPIEDWVAYSVEERRTGPLSVQPVSKARFKMPPSTTVEPTTTSSGAPATSTSLSETTYGSSAQYNPPSNQGSSGAGSESMERRQERDAGMTLERNHSVLPPAYDPSWG